MQLELKKSEAIKLLINDFHNELISKDWIDLDERDEAMIKALKIKKPINRSQTQKLYYITPSKSVFDEVQRMAVRVWDRYDDEDKNDNVSKILGMENNHDNIMYIINMFDKDNQEILFDNIS